MNFKIKPKKIIKFGGSIFDNLPKDIKIDFSNGCLNIFNNRAETAQIDFLDSSTLLWRIYTGYGHLGIPNSDYNFENLSKNKNITVKVIWTKNGF